MLHADSGKSTHGVEVSGIFQGNKLCHLVINGVQLILGGHACLVVGFVILNKSSVVKGADSYHKEFVQIGLEYL